MSATVTLFVCCVWLIAAVFAQYTITDETWKAANGTLVLVKKILNQKTSEYALITTMPGGRLEALFLRSRSTPSKLVDMISGHNGNATAILENVHYKGCPLMPWANRIAQGTYVWYGKRYYLPINEPAKNDSLHGFLYLQNMTVHNQVINANDATLQLSKRFSKHLGNEYPGYPFEFSVVISYTLNDTGFHIHTRAENTGNANSSQAMPWYMAWHPYFKVKSMAAVCIELDMDYDWVNEFIPGPNMPDSSLIPTGYCQPWTQFNGHNPIGMNSTSGLPTYYDAAFRISSDLNQVRGITRSKVIDVLENTTMVLWQDRNFAFNQLYTGIAYQTGEQAVAFEPQSASTDGYNNGDHLTVLYPGQSVEMEFGFYVE